MDPELKALLDKAKEAIGLQAETQKAIDEIKAWGEEKGRLAEAEKAVQQVNDQIKAVTTDFEKKLQAMARQVYDANGRYHGRCFASEDQSRSFALSALLVTSAFGSFARGVLEAEYGDFYKALTERATGTAHAGESSLVAHEHSTYIERLVETYGVARDICRVMPVGAATGTWHSRASGLRARRTRNRTAVAEQTAGWVPRNWSIDDWDILVSYPMSMNADMLVAFGELLADEMALGFAIAEDEDMFIGDGTDDYDNVVGFVPRLININGVDDGGGLVIADGNAWSEITEANVDKTIGQARYVDPRTAAITCSNEFFWQVLQRITGGKGGVTRGEAETGPRYQYKGTTVKINPVMPRAQGNSQIPMLYGDFKKGGTLYTRKEMEMRESREVRFESKEVVLLATERIDMDPHSIGDATTPGPVVGLITAAG